MSVVVSGDFFHFRLPLPSLLFLPIEEVAAAHSDFDRCPRGGGLRTENPPDRHFLSHILRSKIIAPWDMSQSKTPRAFRWKRAFSSWISKFASFWLYFEQANWTRPREKLGCEVNFLSTVSSRGDQCAILTPSPQRHQAIWLRKMLRKMPIGRIFGAQTTSAWTMVEIVVCGLSRKLIGGEAVSSRGLRTMTLNDKFEKH